MENKIYTYDEVDDFGKIPTGSIIEEKIVNWMRDSVPPLLSSYEIVVNGECYSHYNLDNVHLLPLYQTYIKSVKGNWIYCGALYQKVIENYKFIQEFISLGFQFVAEPMFGFFDMSLSDGSKYQLRIHPTNEETTFYLEKWEPMANGIMEQLNTRYETMKVPSNLKQINDAITYFNDSYGCNFQKLEYKF